jgi:hypothetical protein
MEHRDTTSQSSDGVPLFLALGASPTMFPDLPPRPPRPPQVVDTALAAEREKESFRSIPVPQPEAIPSWPCMLLRQHAGLPNEHGSQVIISDLVRQLHKNERSVTDRGIEFCAKYKENLLHEIKTNQRLRDTLCDWECVDFSPWIEAADNAIIITSPGQAARFLMRRKPTKSAAKTQ